MRFRLRPSTLGLIAAALGLGLAWHGVRSGGGPDPAAELARLVPGHRPLLARTSLETPHAPFDPAAPAAGPAEREAIYARLLAAKVEGVAAAASALAAFYATRGEPGDAERALAEAVDPVDRGAALLALDRSDEALEELAKALAARPDDPAARFDRALALEKLQLDGQAKEAWDAFLARERAGPWADEARERLAAIGRRPEVEPPLDGRKHDAWKALQDQAGPDGLERWDGLADELAQAGDRLLLAELAYLRTLDEAGWRRRAAEIRRFRAATAAVFAGRNADAELRALEGSAETYLAVKAVQFAAYSAIVRGDRPVAFAALDRLRDRCLRAGCAEELALAESDRGTLLKAVGDTDGALAAYETASAALPASFAVRHAELLGKTAVLANALGAYEDAARKADRGIFVKRGPDHGNTLVGTLLARATASQELGRSTTAEAFLREAVAVARTNPDRVHEVRIVLRLGQLLADFGRLSEASALVEALARRLDATDLVEHRGWAMAESAKLRLMRGIVDGARDQAQEASVLARRAGSAGCRLASLEVLGKTSCAAGDAGAAEAALREAATIDRDRAARAPGGLARYQYQFEASERRLGLARLLGERGAAREALEMFLGGPPPAPRTDECRIGLAVVNGDLLSFSISGEGVRYQSRRLSRPSVESSDTSSGRWAREIGSPWGPGRCPDDARRIAVLMPPGAIGLPLVENARRARPGSLVGVALRPGSSWPGTPRTRSALALHSPVTDPGAGLPALPGGAQEAGALARIFSSVVDLAGTEATPAALAARARGQDLLHLSAHGVARPGKGTASWLLLAGEGRAGRLRVPDVLGLGLEERRPLVVLSACRAAGTPTEVEGDGGGLPWAFLQSGASGVVATGKAVPDDVAVAFSRHFYAALGEGLPPAEALARATNLLERERGEEAHSGYVLFF